jgi:hypothetical protein
MLCSYLFGEPEVVSWRSPGPSQCKMTGFGITESEDKEPCNAETDVTLAKCKWMHVTTNDHLHGGTHVHCHTGFSAFLFTPSGGLHIFKWRWLEVIRFPPFPFLFLSSFLTSFFLLYSLFSLLSLLWKNRVGLWYHVAVWVCACAYSPYRC